MVTGGKLRRAVCDAAFLQGSILGAIVSGFALGILEGLTKVFYPEASNTVVFVLMVLVLLVKPTGLTGRAA